MRIVKLLFCCIVLLFAGRISSAQDPAPAPEQTEMILIEGGTLHTGNGTVIENGVVAFASGKITYAGDAKGKGGMKDLNSYKVIDVNGKRIYPGIIALNSTLGLTEIDLVRSTRDYYEVGEMNPNVRAAISYNTDSKIIPTVRSNGVLLAEATPQGGTISGTSSVMMLDGWNWEDGLLKENNIPVVIARTHLLPPREDEDVDLPYKLPFLLTKAGISVSITDDNSWPQRNIPFQAGTAAAHGLTKEEALTCITLNPAKVLGIDSTTGTVETGKDATLFISSGDAVDMRTNNVELAFIRGKEIVLDDVQKQLYRKYMKKYGLN